MVFVVPMSGSYRIVFVPIYQGYELPDTIRDKLVADIESFLRKSGPLYNAVGEPKK
jgi:hypothetical protein